mgnify:CR=1 FL=1
MKKFTLITLFILAFALSYGQNKLSWTSTFETVNLGKADTFWNGSDESEGFLNGRAFYRNIYDTTYNVWSGVSVSSMTDTTTTGYTNQYSSITGSGVNYSKQYAVIGTEAIVVLDTADVIDGCYVTNGTYAARSMENGDGFAKKFGGTSGNDPDFFRIIATGYIGKDSNVTSFYLADFRFNDNTEDYIITDWMYFDLAVLGDVDSIRFTLESSDTGQYGMNTPGFFCLDNFNAEQLQQSGYGISNYWFDQYIPNDSFENGANYNGGFRFGQVFFKNDYNPTWQSWSGWSISSMKDSINGNYSNQYSSITGGGAGGSQGYLVGYSDASIYFPYSNEFTFNPLIVREYRMKVSNSTYGYKTMKDGNNFAKKFGGDSGDDKDFLVLKACAISYDGSTSDTLEHYLADYRFDDNSKDYILNDWATFDLHDILFNQTIVRLDFWIEGSDTGQYGLNTPAYFCVDQMLPMFGSVKDKKVEVHLSIFPNPVSDKLYLDIDARVSEVQIIDIQGNMHQEYNGSRSMFDISNLANGVYFIRLNTDKGIVSKQFIKK